ncbi:DUF6993 domain-containing protein [Arthrobacter sp. Leaf141]|uniref:DUF6993 domain-containing protein n=1 Tax=Arthrobacter sp. Leaf141 TaxID=1736273 RepID=UPI000AD8CAE7|nr:hypothetical protein [Arthrobacter sp. Leaf141]
MRLNPSLRQTNHTGVHGRDPRSETANKPGRTRTAVTLAVVAAVLSGCAGGATVGTPPIDSSLAEAAQTGSPQTGSPEAPTSSQSASAQSPQAGTPAASPSGSAQAAAATDAVKQSVTDALVRLAAAAPKPATEQVTDALTGSGVAPGFLEVSQSRTPTGLAADSIEAAVLQGTDCIIGQVREGAVTVTVLPVLASGKCFAGS